MADHRKTAAPPREDPETTVDPKDIGLRAINGDTDDSLLEPEETVDIDQDATGEEDIADGLTAAEKIEQEAGEGIDRRERTDSVPVFDRGDLPPKL